MAAAAARKEGDADADDVDVDDVGDDDCSSSSRSCSSSSHSKSSPPSRVYDDGGGGMFCGRLFSVGWMGCVFGRGLSRGVGFD